MRLAALQFRPHKRQPDTSRLAIRELIREAAHRGAEVIVCPEMATAGYIWPDAAALLPYAEPASGPTFQMLSEEARRAGAWVICGFPERSADGLYNSALVVAPDGTLAATYRKILLFEADETWAQSGTERMLIHDVAGGLAPAICMDLNDDRLLDWLARTGPGLVAFCTNWLEEHFPVHLYWSWRLQRYGGWFVAANAWGLDDGTEFCGQSAIFAPGGVLVAAAPREGDGVLIVDQADYPAQSLWPTERA